MQYQSENKITHTQYHTSDKLTSNNNSAYENCHLYSSETVVVSEI